MRFSLNWLKEFVDLNGIELNELVEVIDSRIVAVKKIEFTHLLNNAHIVGRVVKILHMDVLYKTLTVDLGDKEIICQTNAEFRVLEGQNYVFRSSADFGSIEMCTTKCIGIYKDEVIPVSNSYSAGMCALEVSELKDVIITVDPHIRGDLMGHYGLARELSVIYDRPLIVLEVDALRINRKISHDWSSLRSVVLAAFMVTNLCFPASMLLRLLLCGIEIKRKTDICLLSEYIMLELGVPLATAYISKNELRETIDEEKDNIGILKMGSIPLTKLGLEFFCGDELKRKDEIVLVYSALFDPNIVRKYLFSLSKSTLQADRNCGYCSLDFSQYAITRFLTTLAKISHNTVLYDTRIEEINIKYITNATIIVSDTMVRRITGEQDLWQKAAIVFEALGLLKKKISEQKVELVIPFWRNEIDLNHPASFVRELIRMTGSFYSRGSYQCSTVVFKEYTIKERLKRSLTTAYKMEEIYFRPSIYEEKNNAFSETNEAERIFSVLSEKLSKHTKISYFGIKKYFFVDTKEVRESEYLYVICRKDCIFCECQKMISVISNIINVQIVTDTSEDNGFYILSNKGIVGKIRFNKEYLYLWMDVSNRL